MHPTTIGCALVLLVNLCHGEKLSPGQRAPPGAGSAGGIALTAPLRGNAADVGRRSDVGRSGGSLPPPAPSPSRPATASNVDGVIREETEELKEVNGELVRVVKGNFGYNSPEGLPIAVKYAADENGNRASFTIGKPGSGASRGSSLPKSEGGPPRSGTSSSGRGAGAGAGAGGGGGGGGGTKSAGDSTYLPPASKMNPDRSYLPPS